MFFLSLFFSAPFFANSFNTSSASQTTNTNSAAVPQTTFSVAEDGVVYNVLPIAAPTTPFGFFFNAFFNSFNPTPQITSINGVPVGNNQVVTLPSGASFSVLTALS